MNCNAIFYVTNVTEGFVLYFSLFSEGDCVEPCQHGGTCVQGMCICPLNYEGEHCENGKLF